MPEKRTFTILLEASLCSLGLMVFSYFVHHPFPLSLISFAALLFSAIMISRNISSLSDLKKIGVANKPFRIVLLYLLAGVMAGVILSLIYRSHLDLHLFPSAFQLFTITAALIGITEELVFRGFLQGFVKPVNGMFSIFFSTLSHTGYKVCLFLSPFIAAKTDPGFLALWTFIAGMVLGSLRHLSGSLWPPVLAHIVFDVWVYGECTGAPWWVW